MTHGKSQTTHFDCLASSAVIGAEGDTSWNASECFPPLQAADDAYIISVHQRGVYMGIRNVIRQSIGMICGAGLVLMVVVVLHGCFRISGKPQV